MAKAGYCGECETHVWLQEDGSCEHGHAPSSVLGIYDAEAAGLGEADRTAVVKSGLPSSTVGKLALALGLLATVVGLVYAVPGWLQLGSGALQAAAPPAATQSTCFSQQGRIASAAQQMVAAEPGVIVGTDIASLLSDLRSKGYLNDDPSCPSGGTYSLVVGSDMRYHVSCSVHGSAGP